MTTDEKLVYMANQIARNFARMGGPKAAAATADHLARYWDPGMRTRIFQLLDTPGCGLDATAAEAVRRLRQQESEIT